jgi:hypothetical protein
MSEYLIFQVQCSVVSDYSLKYRPIQCDMLVLLQEEGIIRTTAELNPCYFPTTILRLAHQQRMKQIILTSCSVVMENDDDTSFLVPLTPTPCDFWLEDGMIQHDIHFDFFGASRMLEGRRAIDLLKQPMPECVNKEQELMEKNKVEKQLIYDASVTNTVCDFACGVHAHLLTTNRSHQPIIEPSNSTPNSFAFGKNDGDVRERSLVKQELSSLELYLQQEVAKNDRLIGFLVISTIVFLTIFGFVGYRILPKTKLTSKKAVELKNAWKAKQQIRHQDRLKFEKPFLLKPTETATANHKLVKLEPKLVCSRPVSITPPRPLKSPLLNVAPKSPPRIRSPEIYPRKASFMDELKAKAVKNAPVNAPVSWEDLM